MQDEHLGRDYPSTFTDVWKKIELNKGKSYCEVVIIAAWYLGQIPGGVSGGKTSNIFQPFHVLKAIKWFTD